MSRTLPLAAEDGARARLIAHVRTPLFGGAYALIFSSASTSALGLLYWALAARLYDSDDVGINAAAISTMTFISYLAQLNLAGVLTRFIPTAGHTTGRLIVGAYAAATLLSGVAAAAFVLVVAHFTSPRLTLIGQPVGAVWFVLATMSWSLFALQDAVLTGLRRTVWVPVENTVFAVAKIALLVLFVGALEGNGIFASWTIPAVLLLLPVNLAIFRWFIGRHVARGVAVAPEVQLRGILPYLTGDYIGSLFVSATVGLMPLIVLSVVGASGSAYFYVGWTIAYSLQLISINMATSLMVESSARRDRLAHDSRRMLMLLFRLQVPAVIVVTVGAPYILRLFGTSYAAEAETLLRLLALAVIPHGINAIYLSLARVQRRIARIILVQATIAIAALVLSVLLLGQIGIAGVGLAWLLAQGAVALVVFTTQLWPLWAPPRPVIDTWSDAFGSAREPAAGLLERLATTLDAAELRWALLRSDRLEPSIGDIDMLVAAPDLEDVATELRQMGFMELPSHGRGSHRFFLARDPGTGEWANLDLVTDLAYGRWFELRAPVATEVLGRRQRASIGWRLADDDAFWTLLLHCLLDKRAVSARHARRLLALVDASRDDGPVGALLLGLLPDGQGGEQVRAAVRASAWTTLLELGPTVGAAWRRRDRPGVVWRSLVGATMRGLEPMLLLGRRRGLSVALMGPDGAGKSTLAAGIAEEFGLPVRRVYMGMWATTARRRVPGLAIAIRPFAMWRRWLIARFHVAVGRLVIFDRYTYDALIPPTGSLTTLKRAYFWLLSHTIPAPDLVFILDAPGDLLHARKGEFDPDRLETDRMHFRSFAGRVPNVVVVDATRDPEAVRAEVTDRIWRRFAGGPGAWSGVPPARPVLRRAATGAALRVERARRRLLDRRPRTRALEALPAILASLPAHPAAFDEGWTVLRAARSETGVTVAMVGPAGAQPRLVVKIATDPEAGEAIGAHVARLSSLRADPRLEGWARLLPVVLGSGRSADAVFVAETALPGVPAESLVRDPAIRRALLPAAGAAIGELHRRTASERIVDRGVLDEWVEGPIRRLAQVLAPRDTDGASLRRLEWLGGRLGEALMGRTMSVGWVHGDYWPGNLMAMADGRSISGIVDWDQAAPGLPPMHDIVHLLLYTRRLTQHRELGDVVRGFLGGEPLDDVELATTVAAGFQWPSREDVRMAVALSWLRHVGTFVALPRHGSNRLWMQRNVDAVLRDLTPPGRP